MATILNTLDNGGVTTAPVAAPVSAATPVRPEFIRLPKSGNPDPWTGMTRSGINGLVLPCSLNKFKPPVRSVSLRRPGTVKGVRLVHLASLLDYLNAHQEGGDIVQGAA